MTYSNEDIIGIFEDVLGVPAEVKDGEDTTSYSASSSVCASQTSWGEDWWC